jgi:hypothetical protein
LEQLSPICGRVKVTNISDLYNLIRCLKSFLSRLMQESGLFRKEEKRQEIKETEQVSKKLTKSNKEPI